MKKILLLTFALLAACFAQAQEKLEVPTIEPSDEVYIYEGKKRTKNMPQDNGRVLMESADIELLNTSLQNSRTSVAWTPYSDYIYIDVRSQGKPKCVFMIWKKKVFVDYRGAFWAERKIKLNKKSKAQIRALYEKFLPMVQEQDKGFAKYDNNPMELNVHQVGHLPFVPHSIGARFVVAMDSSKIVPIWYYVHKKKRSGKIIVHRNVMEELTTECAGIDSEGRILAKDKDGKILSLKFKEGPDYIMEELLSIFPEWNNLTNQERMRLLDRYLIE